VFSLLGKVLRSALRRGLRDSLCGGLEQIAQRRASPEEAGSDGVQGEFEEVSDLGVAQLFEFTEEKDFAVDEIESFNGTADPQSGFCRVLLAGIGCERPLTEKRGPKSGLATIGAQDLEANGVEIGTEEGAGLVAGGGAEKSKKSFLGQFFRVGGFEDAAAEKSENGLLVPGEKFAKRIGRTLGKREHELFIADI
jgi:hypothetical protein